VELADAVALRDKLYRRLTGEKGQARRVGRHLDYFRGKHPLRMASLQFQQAFQSRYTGFADNWCAPVAQAPSERMNFLGVRLPDAEQRDVDDELRRVWTENDADGGSSEALLVMLTTGKAYALVWSNPDDEDTPRLTWEHPAHCIVGYDADTGRPVAGLKTWRDENTEFATLYAPDEVWKWQRTAQVGGQTTSGLYVVGSAASGGWAPRQPKTDDKWPLENPMGMVALVELRNMTLLDDDPISDIAGVEAMQDAINLVWAYLFNALDFASLPQRVVLGTDVPEVPVLDDQGQVVGKRKLDIKRLMQDRILWLINKDAKIDSWSAADLDPFSAVIEQAVEHVSAQTRTPPHYMIGKVQNVNAEALTVAETGLVAKTGERITYTNRPMRRIHQLLALAKGDTDTAAAIARATLVWGDPQYRSIAQKTDALVKLKAAGFPLEWLAEWYGLPPEEVTRVMNMLQSQANRVAGGDLAALIAGPKPQPEDGPPGPAPMP
jgi:hypothetical protein